MIFSPALRVIKIERILILKALISTEEIKLFFGLRKIVNFYWNKLNIGKFIARYININIIF
jgi:hypothetical protein